MKANLSDRLLRSLAVAQNESKEIWDSSLRGFGCRIGKTGLVTFFAMRRQRGVAKAPAIRINIGTFPPWSLADARLRARALLRDLQDGIDPRKAEAERLQAEALKQANTFGVVAEAFIARHVVRARTARAIELRVRRELIARWEGRPITEIARADVIRMIEEIVDRGHTEAARLTFTYARKLFRWAISRDIYGLQHAPTDHIDARDLIGARKARQRVLDERELRLLWRATEDAPYPNAQYVRLLLLLGVRRTELGKASWDEFDLDSGLWVIPPIRMKNADGHVVPLCPAAVEILRALPRFSSGYVFTARGTKPLNDFGEVKRLLDIRITELNGGAPIAAWTLHDLRRTFRTALSALGIAPHICELCIGHRQRGIVAVYDLHRYDAEKRHAFDAWAARLANIVAPMEGKVVRLHT